jgi:hypothetical protein
MVEVRAEDVPSPAAGSAPMQMSDAASTSIHTNGATAVLECRTALRQGVAARCRAFGNGVPAVVAHVVYCTSPPHRSECRGHAVRDAILRLGSDIAIPNVRSQSVYEHLFVSASGNRTGVCMSSPQRATLPSGTHVRWKESFHDARPGTH